MWICLKKKNMKRIHKSLKIIQNPIKEMNRNNFVETEEVYNFSLLTKVE